MATNAWREDLGSCRPCGIGMWREPGITNIEADMLEKHDHEALAVAASEAWKDVNFTKVNGFDVRRRLVSDKAANFHSHVDSDELFCCLEGVVDLDVENGDSVADQVIIFSKIVGVVQE